MCVQNLNWSHFRSLLRVHDENARIWYMNESAQGNWSSRTLERNISTQYYYRLLQSPNKTERDNNQLFMSKYMTCLPTKEQLQAEIKRQKEVFYMQHPQKIADNNAEKKKIRLLKYALSLIENKKTSPTKHNACLAGEVFIVCFVHSLSLSILIVSVIKDLFQGQFVL